MGGRGRVEHVPKVLRDFLPKYWVFFYFGHIKKLPNGCSKYAHTKVNSSMSKMEGGSRQL